MKLRPVTDADLPEVLALNHRNVAVLAEMDEEKYRRIAALADRCDVIDVDGRVGGFVITIGPGTAYWSPNYAWFAERYDDFYYLDRIVLHHDFRRQGLGNRVYDELEQVAARHGRMTLEANADNEPSLAFHRARGYRAVGDFAYDGQPVTMMVKELGPG